MMSGMSTRSLAIVSSRAFSSVRSGDPGAYDLTGSFTGGGTRRIPVNADSNPDRDVPAGVDCGDSAARGFGAVSRARTARAVGLVGAAMGVLLDALRANTKDTRFADWQLVVALALDHTMRSGQLLRHLPVSSLSLLLACGRAPIEWSEPAPIAAELATDSALAFADTTLVAARAPRVVAPDAPGQCAGSARVAHDSSTGDWYAAWWGKRADGTADILASHSRDGVAWAPPVRVDTSDAAPVGCDRPPPSVTADAGNFYVVYAMTAREGPGIFASHSMDRGTMFHSPVAVVYGERIGRAAVAATGSIVAVAYEDPNTEPRRISLALSRTMGHLFQSRMIVSPPTGRARAPAVALRAGRIAVAWSRGDSASATQRMVRFGEIP
jgi:hypothetical protein